MCRALKRPPVGVPPSGIVTLTAMSQGLGLNPGEFMDFCNCFVTLRQGGTLNSRRAASPLGSLVDGEGRREANPWVLSLNIVVEPSQIVLSPT
ncbi:hypothetical protein TNCV_1348111 [Trichonephila clavipes]|nr:hypothetical protein TNCV_1348111 [Trichonephila clavipes]